MNRIRETLARLTRAARGSRDETATFRRTTNAVRGSSLDDVEYGPLVLYNEIQDGEEGVDIVLVHDLYGNRISSWTKGAVCWPRDLLAHDLPGARVIVWGWASAGFADQADLLLADISRMRNGTTRPIIFVGHGLGGVVIKEALVTAAMSRIYGSHTSLGNVYPKTVGCIFLGTPHTRSGKRSLGDVVAAAALLAPRTPSLPLLRALRDSNETLEQQHGTFLMISRDIRVVCMREELPTMVRDPEAPGGGKGAMAQVMIPRDCAAYAGNIAANVTRDEIRANHADIARFAERDDLGYLQIVAHLSRMSCGPSPAQVEARAIRNQEILDTLYFDTMREREARIDSAYGQTCEWILSPKVSPFHDYLKSNDPILWISGKAGSGKSTLMKYAWSSEKVKHELADGWAKDGDLHMACFFMFEGGNRIQKSYEGILRSVLYQVLSTRTDLINVCFPSFFDGPWPPPTQFNSITNLNQGVYSLFAHMSETLRLFVFLDGIDEYRIMERKDYYAKEDLEIAYGDDFDTNDEAWGRSKWINDSHQEIAKLVTSMASKDVVKFIITSRELPIFDEAFADLPKIRLQEHTEKAIAMYVEGRLEDEAPGLPDSKNLCKHVAQKSRGDILWAKLAIDMVVDCSLRTLKPTLDSLPTQLGGPDGLYMRMLENLSSEYQCDANRIFHLVLKAQEPPSLLTLAFAEEGHVDPVTKELRITLDSAQPHTRASIQKLTDNQQARLQTRCAGLLVAEAEPSDNSVEMAQRVVFVHQTSKEWVGRKDVWQRLPSTPVLDEVELDFSLLSGCVRHLMAFDVHTSAVSVWSTPKFLPDAWFLIANTLRYAERIDGSLGDDAKNHYFALMDALDMTCQAAWMTALHSQKPINQDPDWYERKMQSLVKKHWASLEPMEVGKSPKRKDFLALAVQANLLQYVAHKLESLDPEMRKKKAQELLVYCVSPHAEGFSACVSLSGDCLDFHRDMPDTRLLDILFDSGASVKDSDDDKNTNSSKTWIKALKTGRRYFSRGSATMSHLMETGASRRLMLNRERWVAAVKALLLHGADPNVEIQITGTGTGAGLNAGGIGEENGSTDIVVAGDFIRGTLEGEPEYALELMELEMIMGRRGSVQINS